MSRPSGWIRLANDLGSSDRVLELDHYLESLALYVLTIGYCDRQRADGVVPRRAFGRAIAPGVDTEPLIADLLNAGMLEEVGAEHYAVHQYLRWQRSAEDIEGARDKATKAANARYGATKDAPSIHDGMQTDRQDQTDKPDETDRTDVELGMRLVDWIARERGAEEAQELTAVIFKQREQYGHSLVADAVERYIRSPEQARQPVRFFTGILNNLAKES